MDCQLRLGKEKESAGDRRQGLSDSFLDYLSGSGPVAQLVRAYD